MSTSTNNSTIVMSLDANGFEAGVNKVRVGASAVTAAQDAMAKKTEAMQRAITEATNNGIEPNVRALSKLYDQTARTAETVGKSTAQLLEQRAAALGASGAFAGMVSHIAEASKHTEEMGFKTAGAKRELLVIAHELSQGNLKKAFGSVMVLGERTGAAGLLFSAAGLSAIGLAAAIAAVTYEIVKGVMAFDALAKASQTTNGYIGLTNGQLSDMAKTIAGTTGSITGVEESMAALVGSGRIAADQLSLATKVTAEFAHDTGLAADKAAEAMVKFAEDPKKALEELQTHYHTFSAAQVEVIDGYIKTGDMASAYKAILEGMDEAHQRFSKTGVEQVGTLQKAWQLLKADVIDTINHISQIGVPASDVEKMTDAVERQSIARKTLADAQAHAPNRVEYAQAELAAANAQVEALKKVEAVQQSAAQANAARARSGDGMLASNAYQEANKHPSSARVRDSAIGKENAEFNKATKDLDKSSAAYQEDLKQHLDAISKINEDYAHKNKGKTVNPDTEINAQIKALQYQSDALKTIYTQQVDAAKGSFARGEDDAKVHAAKLLMYQEQELYGQAALAQKQAELAGGKKQTEAQQAYLNTVKKLYAEADKAATDYAANVIASNNKELIAVQKFADGQERIAKKQQEGYNVTNATSGMSSSDAAKYKAQEALLAQHMTVVEQLTDQFNTKQISQGVYTANINTAQQSYDKQVAQQTAQYAKLEATDNSYFAQIKNAMTQSAGNSQTTAQDIGNSFTSVYGSMSSALEQFVVNGKGSFAGFASSIIGDLAKIALKAAETQIMTSVISMFSTGGSVGSGSLSVGGGTRSFAGGGVTGEGSGTSDSIPAMLSNGEYVINAASTKKYGSLLDSINNGTMSHFASGGAVGTVAPSAAASSGNNISLSLGAANSGLTMQDLQAIAPHIQTLVDKRMAMKMSQQGGYADLIRQGKI